MGLVAYGIWWYYNYKTWSKRITAFELIGENYQPTIRDNAKTVKIGKGGFEVLYLKKLKVYKLSGGARVGKNDYYFFVGRDYWYNGVLGSQITIDGKTPIITTSPSMRSQYTSLEKMVEQLHGSKVTFWDKYGNWVMSIGFVIIIGVLAWLIFKEFSGIVAQIPGLIDRLAEVVDKVAELVDKVNKLLVATDTQQGGLTQVQ